MDFADEAEAYDNRFPAIGKVVLRKGSVSFSPLVPSEDITLLTTTAALVVKSDMHPALVSLLTHAVISNPRPGFDKEGDPVLFYKRRRIPSTQATPSSRFRPMRAPSTSPASCRSCCASSPR